jgi:predicted glycoside hydrolase/deacetylase ChbG (UPF0249 family)
MAIQLIITGDDCGLSDGINHATLRLYERGMLSSASLMTNFRATAHALHLFRQQPGLEIGVHLNLSDGLPLTDLPPNSDLTRPDGRFRDRYVLWAKALFPSTALLAMIEAELRAQIEVIEHAGIQPAHLTSHCHFHAIPAIREIVYRLAAEYAVTWVRATDYRSTSVPNNWLLQKQTRSNQELPFVVPDYLVGLRHWLDKPPSELVEEIQSLNGIVEIIVHPGDYRDVTFPEGVRYSPAERQAEMVYLEEFHELLVQQSEIQITRLQPAPARFN